MKPRLTAKTVERLTSLTVYALSEVDAISTGTEDQQEEAREVRAACDWIDELCAWYRGQHRDSKPSSGIPDTVSAT